MNFLDYEKAALRTAKLDNAIDESILEGALGMAGECGEVCDLIKKAIFQGHSLDFNKLAEELGDVLWYVTLLAYEAGYPLEEVAKLNIQKLYKRYPNGFRAEDSINRDKPKETFSEKITRSLREEK